MFFPRLRRQAKWVFYVLILVFGAGFVFLGVGSGGLDLGTLVQDLHLGSGSSKPSLSKAQDAVQKEGSPANYRKLAEALAARGRTVEAISAYERVVALAPRDTDGSGTLSLDKLAGLQRTRLSTLGQEYVAAQEEYRDALAEQNFGASSTSTLGQALSKDPIASVVSSTASTRYSKALTDYQSAAGAVVATYKKRADAFPRNSSYTFDLAGVAAGYNDYKTAIAAYKKFLVLDPDSSDAPAVRARLKQLERTQKASAAGG